jgi:hypothetical protein
LESIDFNNIEGKGIIKIKTVTGGSYFMFENPLSILWSDCGGSIAQYFALTNYSHYEQNIIVDKLDRCLNADYENMDSLLTDFNELFNLMEVGKYVVTFEKEFNKGDWYDSIILRYNNNDLLTNKEIFTENKKNIKISQQKIDDYSKWFYDESSGHGNFLFTRAFETINQERVVFFENEIKNGKRPFVILLSKSFYSHIGDTISASDSGWFIVDGHHKLLAYQNLKILPAVLKINQVVTKEIYTNFDTRDLENNLMQIQLEHIRKNIQW